MHALLLEAKSEEARKPLRFLKWALFGIAALIQTSIFILIGIALGRSTGDGDSDEDSSYLWRVVASVYYLFYLSFPIVYVLWYTGKLFTAFWQVEISFILLSLSSKVSLFWLIASSLEYIRTLHSGWEAGVWISASVPLACAIILPPLILRFFLRDAWETEKDVAFTLAQAQTVSVSGSVVDGTTGTELQRLLHASSSKNQ